MMRPPSGTVAPPESITRTSAKVRRDHLVEGSHVSGWLSETAAMMPHNEHHIRPAESLHRLFEEAALVCGIATSACTAMPCPTAA